MFIPNSVQQAQKGVSVKRKIVSPLKLLQILPEEVIFDPTARVNPSLETAPAAIDTIGMYPAYTARVPAQS